MKYTYLFIIVFIFSCNNSDKPVKQTEEVPKALDDGTSGSDVGSFSLRKSYSQDLPEELYRELTEKNPNFKAISVLLSEIYQMESDSLARFNNYNEKSRDYYNSATRSVSSINDSILKTSLLALIKNSAAAYDNKIASTQKLADQINQNSVIINDLMKALKITSTIKLIEKYQNKQIDTKPMKALLKKQEELIQLINNESNKTP